jgi:peptidoglycan/LPS O-acetylase OafA/YrhL
MQDAPHVSLDTLTAARFSYFHGLAPPIFSRPLWQWPFIRLLWMGDAMVTVFFVLSGYVLSYKFLKQLSVQQNRPVAVSGLYSASLRRFPRLYIPTMASVWLIAFLSYIGVFEITRRNRNFDDNRWGLIEDAPPRGQNVIDHLHLVGRDSAQVMHFWSLDMHHSAGDFDQHTWTIRAEMTTSLLLFAALAATYRMTSTKRMVTFAAISIIASFSWQWTIMAFFAGACTAMWELQHTQATLPVSSNKKAHAELLKPTMSFRTGLGITLLATFLASAPIGRIDSDVFYARLWAMFPQEKGERGSYLRAMGSIMLMWPVLYWPPATRFFSHRFPVYLGKISFAFYLVHGPVLRLVFHGILPVIYKKMGDGETRPEGSSVLLVAWLAALVSCMPLSIWLADLGWRYVDRPTVQMCQRIRIGPEVWPFCQLT